MADLQQRLISLGYEIAPDSFSFFGQQTELLLKEFQSLRGLKTDGVCGEQTWSALVEASYKLYDRLLYRRSPPLRGDDVAELQLRLSQLGFDTGRVDGILGENTATAIMDFQQNAGLVPDGICGPSTIKTLDRMRTRGNPTNLVTGVREKELLRLSSKTLKGKKIALGEMGGINALVTALTRSLTSKGADVFSIHHPNPSKQAAILNKAKVEVFLGFSLGENIEGIATSYYSGYKYESVGGKYLSELIQSQLPPLLKVPNLGSKGMSTIILRETIMPAVVCELFPPSLIVEHLPQLVEIITSTLTTWSLTPFEFTPSS